MRVDVNRPKGKNVERRLTGEKTQRLWALSRVHTIVKWAMVGRYLIAGDYYVRSAVLSREERIVFLRNNSRKREKMGRLDCDVRVGKL